MSYSQKGFGKKRNAKKEKKRNSWTLFSSLASTSSSSLGDEYSDGGRGRGEDYWRQYGVNDRRDDDVYKFAFKNYQQHARLHPAPQAEQQQIQMQQLHGGAQTARSHNSDGDSIGTSASSSSSSCDFRESCGQCAAVEANLKRVNVDRVEKFHRRVSSDAATAASLLHMAGAGPAPSPGEAGLVELPYGGVQHAAEHNSRLNRHLAEKINTIATNPEKQLSLKFFVLDTKEFPRTTLKAPAETIQAGTVDEWNLAQEEKKELLLLYKPVGLSTSPEDEEYDGEDSQQYAEEADPFVYPDSRDLAGWVNLRTPNCFRRRSASGLLSSAVAAGAGGISAKESEWAESDQFAPAFLPLGQDQKSAERQTGGVFRARPRRYLNYPLHELSWRQVPVYVNVYDLDPPGSDFPIQTVNGVFKSALQLGGLFHAGIEIHNREFSFGYVPHGTGLETHAPKQHHTHAFRESIFLGFAYLSVEELGGIVGALESRWPGNSYDLLARNCCNFSDEFAQLLGLGGIPSWIHRFARWGNSLMAKFGGGGLVPEGNFDFDIEGTSGRLFSASGVRWLGRRRQRLFERYWLEYEPIKQWYVDGDNAGVRQSPRKKWNHYVASPRYKAKWVTQERYRFVFVLGNTSCDLDSVCSALALAWILELKSLKQGSGSHSTKKSQCFVPLLNFRRSAYPQLLQQAYFLEKYFGLQADDLCFYEDSCAGAAGAGRAATAEDGGGAPASGSYFLVDHNEIDPGQREFVAPRVVGCIDHHELAGGRADAPPDIFDIHAPTACGPEKIVGSCSSLVLKRLLSLEDGVAGKEEFAELFCLLSGAIICDTRNFSDKTKGAKWSDVGDRNAFEDGKKKISNDALRDFLTGRGSSSSSSGKTPAGTWDAFAQDLFDVKFDVERNLQLGVQGLLSSDYKQFAYQNGPAEAIDVGFATFPIQLISVLERFCAEDAGAERFLGEMENFCAARKIQALVILSSDVHMVKHCGVFCTSAGGGAGAGGSDLYEPLVGEKSPLHDQMGLKPVPGVDNKHIKNGQPDFFRVKSCVYARRGSIAQFFGEDALLYSYGLGARRVRQYHDAFVWHDQHHEQSQKQCGGCNPACAGSLGPPCKKPIWDHPICQNCAGTVCVEDVAQDLHPPPVLPKGSQPAAGKKVLITAKGWEDTQVSHALYLPEEWRKPSSGEEPRKYPILVEFGGNGETPGNPGTAQGWGIGAGKKYIWLVLPLLTKDKGRDTANAQWWWGCSKPESCNSGSWDTYDPTPTIKYAKDAVKETVKNFHGIASQIILVGYSRGGIAADAIGAGDTEIVKLWAGIYAGGHYDGVETWNGAWPFLWEKSGPGGYYKEHYPYETAWKRAERASGVPKFLIAECNRGMQEKNWLRDTVKTDVSNVVAMSNGFRNHSGNWILRPSKGREALRDWADKLCPGDGRAETMNGKAGDETDEGDHEPSDEDGGTRKRSKGKPQHYTSEDDDHGSEKLLALVIFSATCTCWMMYE
eukprot:g5830.t1